MKFLVASIVSLVGFSALSVGSVSAAPPRENLGHFNTSVRVTSVAPREVIKAPSTKSTYGERIERAGKCDNLSVRCRPGPITPRPPRPVPGVR